jgi:hypothetical protein
MFRYMILATVLQLVVRQRVQYMHVCILMDHFICQGSGFSFCLSISKTMRTSQEKLTPCQTRQVTSSFTALTCIRPVRAVSFAFYNSGSRAKEGQSDSL